MVHKYCLTGAVLFSKELYSTRYQSVENTLQWRFQLVLYGTNNVQKKYKHKYSSEIEIHISAVGHIR